MYFNNISWSQTLFIIYNIIVQYFTKLIISTICYKANVYFTSQTYLDNILQGQLFLNILQS